MIHWEIPTSPPDPRDYIFRNGRRYVRPYYFEFICHVKNRWAGKTIVDLFSEEFKGRPYDYYVDAVKSGRIQVDGRMVHVSYVVRNSQKISHFLHRHEPPVVAGSVSVLHSDPDVITVCKPASVPVHSCGQYRKNTVVGILQAEHGLGPLFPVHRLDRLVSGLLIFARNTKKADYFRQQIVAGVLQKEYIAKVIGLFPEGEIVNANVNYDAREGRSSVEVGDEYTGEGPTGKAACTKFIRISTDGTHSVVLCKPVTGRTHQIRVHLQHIGHPIANDALYLSKTVVARSFEGTGADRAASSSINRPPFEGTGADRAASSSINRPLLSDSFDDDDADIHSEKEFCVDPDCTNCPNLGPKGYEGDEEGIWLHCVRYSGPGWSYQCPTPDWGSVG